jgi:hypothetical protein
LLDPSLPATLSITALRSAALAEGEYEGLEARV